jgi:hypothetical protein
MTPQEKKELDFVLKTGLKCAIGIAVLFFALLILTSIL